MAIAFLEPLEYSLLVLIILKQVSRLLYDFISYTITPL